MHDTSYDSNERVGRVGKMHQVVVNEKKHKYEKLNSTTLQPPKKGESEFDDTVSDVAQYGRIQFWDERYLENIEAFDWYYGYEYFRETILDYVPFNKKVMIAGCGNSHMVGDMAKDGYTNIVAADLSRVVIDQMKKRYANIPQISFFQGTMVDTDLPEESIDAIIDKALFDALLCTQTGPRSVAQYIFEIERLLSETGVFILISYGNPEQRLPYLEQYDIDEPYFTPWLIEVQALAKPREVEDQEYDLKDPDSLYFVYICKKSEELVLKKKVKEGKKSKALLEKNKPRRRRAPALKVQNPVEN